MVETRFEEILVKKYPKLIKTIKTQNSRKMTNSKLKKKTLQVQYNKTTENKRQKGNFQSSLGKKDILPSNEQQD